MMFDSIIDGTLHADEPNAVAKAYLVVSRFVGLGTGFIPSLIEPNK
jgi:hypothetical protein